MYEPLQTAGSKAATIGRYGTAGVDSTVIGTGMTGCTAACRIGRCAAVYFIGSIKRSGNCLQANCCTAVMTTAASRVVRYQAGVMVYGRSRKRAM
jgi:hypothetical protein